MLLFILLQHLFYFIAHKTIRNSSVNWWSKADLECAQSNFWIRQETNTAISTEAVPWCRKSRSDRQVSMCYQQRHHTLDFALSISVIAIDIVQPPLKACMVCFFDSHWVYIQPGPKNEANGHFCLYLSNTSAESSNSMKIPSYMSVISHFKSCSTMSSRRPRDISKINQRN